MISADMKVNKNNNKWACFHIAIYEVVFGYFVDICHLNYCYILINYFLLTYKVWINHAPIINRINYLSKNILCLKNDKIVTEINLKSLRTKKR